MLQKTSPRTGAQQCEPFSITLNICFSSPSATVTPAPGTCVGSTPSNNAVINITAATNTDQAGISPGATYTGPAYGGAGTVAITGGTASITGLMHGTQYTVKVYNGSNDCYVDYTVTTPIIQCCNINAISIQSLTCLDNGTPTLTTDNRIRVGILATNSNAILTTYNVSVNGGTTISPSTGTYGTGTFFLLGPGTAGGGSTFTITLTDSTNPGCTGTVQVTDPGNCNNAIPCDTPNCGTATIQVNGN